VFLSRLLSAGTVIGLAACQSTWLVGPNASIAPRLPRPSSPMPDHGFQPPPSGFVSFCVRNPAQCTSPKEPSSAIVLDAAVWTLLVHTNDAVNITVRPMDDLLHHGRAEYWTLVLDGYGDCEDSALTKRKALIDAGVPSAALRIATAVTAKGKPHAVLTVATDHGDYVLDNLNAYIVPWSETGYTWIARQDAQNAWDWSAVGPELGAGTVAATH
jgi:predicted transglutaminase-like cysteine proteinase